MRQYINYKTLEKTAPHASYENQNLRKLRMHFDLIASKFVINEIQHVLELQIK